MNLHEHQAKELLRQVSFPVPRGIVAFSAAEAVKAATTLGGSVFVVKAQIHAGGRGKAGGVKVVKSLAEVEPTAAKMLGMTLVTPQTGAAGRLVRRLYIEEGVAIAKEFYLSILVDRNTGRLAFIASREGGMDIEEVAAKNPAAITTLTIDPAAGVQAQHGRRLAACYGLPMTLAKDCTQILTQLYTAFQKFDAAMLEINPLVLTADNKLIALDAKMSLDDNALYRHPNLAAMRDVHEEDAMELEAGKHNLSYVKLDGNIGCMVNGAGLAMATMDIIKLYGGAPANFLDVGGGATKERVTEAFKLILSDKNVKAILVNIFGGIMRCDVIAEGIIAAAKQVSLSVPLVVRLEGTNVELGKKILATSGLAIIAADHLADAAQKVVSTLKAKAA